MANISINFSEVVNGYEGLGKVLPQLEPISNLAFSKSDADDVRVAANVAGDEVAAIINYVAEKGAKTKTIKVEFDIDVEVDFYLSDGEHDCEKIKTLKGKSIAFMMDPGTVVQLLGKK
ncbi:MAG: hypothetical protein IJC78_02115 [Clostridia bacterium]|nr:hypothetical protein [Clostridia bacterium]